MLGFDYQKIAALQRFRLDFDDLGILGSGGFAEVHRVRNKIDGRLYAAKIIKIRPGNDEDEALETLHRALAEVKIHSKLAHAQILKYHASWMELQPFSEQERAEMAEQEEEEEFQMVVCDDSESSDGFVFGEPEQQESGPKTRSWKKREGKDLGAGKRLTDYKEARVYVLSELCEMNLQSFLFARNLQKGKDEEGERYWRQNYEMALDITRGLGYLHSQRIIHRDVKLHNVVVSNHRCKLIDFGLARKAKYWKSSIQESFRTSATEIVEDGEEEFSKSVGTKLFSSPEQATSERYDYRTDIFSLAMVIVLLFCTFTTAHQQRDLLELIRARKLETIAMPAKLKEVLYRCLGAENERPSLRELTTTLRELLREKTGQVPSIPPLIERNENRIPSQPTLKLIDRIH